MLPKNGLKVVLKDKSVLVKCTPIKALKTGNGSKWQMWCGTVAVRGRGEYDVGTRIIYWDRDVAKTFTHADPLKNVVKEAKKVKRIKKRKPFNPGDNADV